MPQKECGIYTQALMDLGSMVCRRSPADCGSCPLRDGCKGFASGDPSAFPGVKKRAEKPGPALLPSLSSDRKAGFGLSAGK